MHQLKRLSSLLAVSLSLISCSLSGQPSGTMAWIDAPLDGLQVAPGQAVILQGHAAGPTGVERMEFWANDVLLVDQRAPEREGALARFAHVWTPETPGAFTIQLIAYGPNGLVSAPDTITLHVGQVPSASPSTPTRTPERGPDTPMPTPTPTATATATPTVTRTWVPPSVTPTTPPPDTTGPAAPVPISPTGKVILGCTASTTLNWSETSDPSGISQYSLELERHSGDNKWSQAAGSPFGGLGGTSTSVSTECGWYYRWRVRAQDGAGNWGSFSAWALFAVNLG